MGALCVFVKYNQAASGDPKPEEACGGRATWDIRWTESLTTRGWLTEAARWSPPGRRVGRMLARCLGYLDM